jgi:hypothetical protein
MRLATVLLLLAAYASSSSPAAATKPARACIDAHAEGQVERDAGRLLSARERFRSCSSDPCPTLIRNECRALDAALQAEIPSIVLVAQDTGGRPSAGARAKIDGRLAVSSFDGSAIELDPGPHRIEVVLPDGRRQAFELGVERAQQARRVVATFPPNEPSKSADSSGNRLAYVLGGAGLLALGAWGAFAWDGSRKQANLETCAPRCTSRSEVDAMRRSYLVADVLLGVSVAALGTSAYLLISGSATDDTRAGGRSLIVGARGTF